MSGVLIKDSVDHAVRRDDAEQAFAQVPDQNAAVFGFADQIGPNRVIQIQFDRRERHAAPKRPPRRPRVSLNASPLDDDAGGLRALQSKPFCDYAARRPGGPSVQNCFAVAGHHAATIERLDHTSALTPSAAARASSAQSTAGIEARTAMRVRARDIRMRSTR